MPITNYFGRSTDLAAFLVQENSDLAWLGERSDFFELRLDESRFEELLREGYTVTDLVPLAAQHLLWLSQHEFLLLNDKYHFLTASPHVLVETQVRVRSPDGTSVSLRIASIGTGSIDEAHQRVFRLLAAKPASQVVVDLVKDTRQQPTCPFSAETLRYLDHSNLELVEFRNLSLEQAHCDMLATFGSAGELALTSCVLLDGGQALFGGVAVNEGPSQLSLEFVDVDAVALSQALSRTNRLTKLSLSGQCIDADRLYRFFDGLRANTSLIEFGFVHRCRECDWDFMILNCIKRHPTIRKLSIQLERGRPFRQWNQYVPEVFRSRILANMLRSNDVISELHTNGPVPVEDEGIFRREIRPKIKANLFGQRLQAMQLEPNSKKLKRHRLVAAALVHTEVRTDSQTMWLLLSSFHNEIAQLFDKESIQ